MRLRVRHETRYSYTEPIEHASQLVRLTPGEHEGQRVLSWRVHEIGRGALPASDDGFGAVVHMLSLNRRHQGATIVAEGEVETRETHGVVRGALERFPPTFFLRATPATAADQALIEFARPFAREADSVERMHALMAGIRERVEYLTGATSVETTAAQAFTHGFGVCQDHAQIFIACARALGLPARYVSGYLWRPEADDAEGASHGWAETHVEQLGWVGFDPANLVCPTEAYIRIAIGLDYRDAAPIRGIWRGVADETLAVSVDVQQVQTQTQQ